MFTIDFECYSDINTQWSISADTIEQVQERIENEIKYLEPGETLHWKIYFGRFQCLKSGKVNYCSWIMNKQELLNTRLQELMADFYGDEFDDEDPMAFIEYRPFHGWYCVFYEVRYFYDQGEFLGRNYKDALKMLERLFY